MGIKGPPRARGALAFGLCSRYRFHRHRHPADVPAMAQPAALTKEQSDRSIRNNAVKTSTGPASGAQSI